MKPIISKYVLFFLLLVVFASITQGKPVPGEEKVTEDAVCPQIKVCARFSHSIHFRRPMLSQLQAHAGLQCSSMSWMRRGRDHGHHCYDECCPSMCDPRRNHPTAVWCDAHRQFGRCKEGYKPVKEGCCEICILKAECEIVQCVTEPCPPPFAAPGKQSPTAMRFAAHNQFARRATIQSSYLANAVVPARMDRRTCCQPLRRMTACMDPCYSSLSMETDEFVPMCAIDQKCVTETLYISSGADHCPPTGCPHFVECN